MFKRGLIFGLLGFLITLGTIYFTSPDKDAFSQRFGTLTYKDGINGWKSLGRVITLNINEALFNEDYLFVSMFMMKTMERISGKPDIVITKEDNSVFWSNIGQKSGTKYKGWDPKETQVNYYTKDSLSKIKLQVNLNEKVAGYLYLILKIEPNPKSFALVGWKNYGSVLAYSNRIREDIAVKNQSGIKEFINSVTEKSNFIHLTALDAEKKVIWDMENEKTDKMAEETWIEREEDKNKPDRFYFSFPIDYQGKEVGQIHFLVDLPARKATSSLQNKIIATLKNLFIPQNLMLPGISFLIFFLAGSLLGKSSSKVTVSKETTEKEGLSPEEIDRLETQRDYLKEEIKELEKEDEKVTEEIARKQKMKKDLESEIELLEEKKETALAEAEQEARELEEESEEIQEEEQPEEVLLFEDLLGEKSKEKAEKKEELELTQRIVAKRREEIALSGKVEAKRKELMELEKKIGKLKEQEKTGAKEKEEESPEDQEESEKEN